MTTSKGAAVLDNALLREALRCPVCARALAPASGSLRCETGHAFDVARQGYVNLLVGSGSRLAGDSAEMVAARAALLSAGHYEPLAEALGSMAAQTAPSNGLVAEVGAGTGYYLARLVERIGAQAGLALDLSKYAARRAASVHPAVGAAVADATRPLPLADRSCALLACVFAPRAPAEFRRVLRDDGVLLVARPTARHLASLRAALGLIGIDAAKEERLAAALGPYFESIEARTVTWPLHLSRHEAALLAGMGPSARHVEQAELQARLDAMPEPIATEAEVRVEAYRPLPG